MSVIDRVFAEPELQARPPVLVDVGAAGGAHAAWRRIARYSIGVGFEPDSRERGALGVAQREFRRWITCPRVVLPEVGADGEAVFNLTRQPQCSSVLSPNAAELQDWTFAEFFVVEERRRFAATTLAAALAGERLDRVDWLKCDTQGLDLRLFQSLPEDWRKRLLAVEFEPGLMDAYEGEDKFTRVLGEMEAWPFWLADLQVEGVPRGRNDMLRQRLGTKSTAWMRRLGRPAPGWVNARYLRDVARQPEKLNRREYLLAWVFTSLSKQHGQALTTALLGAERFGGALFEELAVATTRSLRWEMVRGLPAALWRRALRGLR